MKLRLILALAMALHGAAASAQDEHRRLLAAELLVMDGDARRLAAAAEPALHRRGLRARLAGALSSLPLLLRRAGAPASEAAPLRAALARDDWRGFSAAVGTLRRRHPFEPGAILPNEATPGRLRLGEAIHRQACAGCHDAPAAETPLPAFNLHEQAKRLPREEFAARLLIGVRGDRSTAWRNPFSDLELGALLAYYQNGKTDGASRK